MMPTIQVKYSLKYDLERNMSDGEPLLSIGVEDLIHSHWDEFEELEGINPDDVVIEVVPD